MMKTAAANAADVHAGTLADRLQAFENGDVFCGIGGHSGIGFCWVLQGSAGFYWVRFYRLRFYWVQFYWVQFPVD
jgi:hypothetical protein